MTRFRWVFWLIGIVSAGFAVRFALHFPWAGTLAAIAGADWWLLAGASVANLLSLSAKAGAWYLLLRPTARTSWRTTQAATFVGAAVNSVSVSLSGEAARVQVVATRDGVALGPAIWSLVWCRLVEAVALLVFLAFALAVMPTQAWTRPVELGAWATLAALLVLWTLGVGPRLLGLLPAGWRPPLGNVAETLGPRRLAAPLALSVANWAAQWLTFHWAVVATHTSTSAAVSLAALVLANVGGVFRITPGNIGVLQASLVLGMLAFHIPEDQALAAGLTLQAVQVIPVIAIGLALVGAQGLRSLGGKRVERMEAA